MKIIALICFAVLPLITSAKELTKIRVGWQVPWSTQGQIVQIWKHTEILKNNGLEAEFVGRTYGPLLNELALAGELDVILTADQPAASLFAKDKGWIGIGRLMYNRTSTYVPPRSLIKNIKDLKGKTIGVPIGAAAERVTIAAIKNSGLDPRKDVKIVNLGLLEQASLIKTNKDKTTWGQFSALSGFDPLPAILEANGLIRILDVGKVCSLVLMNKTFINDNGDVAKKVLAALRDAYDYYRNNTEQANKWFMEEAGLKNIDQKACNIAASIEPNLQVKNRSEIRVSFTEEDFQLMQTAADFLQPNLKKHVDMRQHVTNAYADIDK